jgi:hypothetical protein
MPILFKKVKKYVKFSLFVGIAGGVINGYNCHYNFWKSRYVTVK